MEVSVIIPVYNDSDRLKECLTSLNNQDIASEKFEIIVVDNGSSELIEEVVKQFNNCKYIFEAKIGSYAARNTGIRVASGDLFAFTDADCIPDSKWISSALEYFYSNQPDAIAGRIEFFQKNKNDLTVSEQYDSIIRLDQKRYVEQLGFSATANLFVERNVATELNYFNEDLLSGGDCDFGMRLSSGGYVLKYVPEVVVKHHSQRSVLEVLKKEMRYSGGRYQLERYHESLRSREKKQLSISSLHRLFSKLINSKNGSRIRRLQLVSLALLCACVVLYERMRIELGGSPRRA